VETKQGFKRILIPLDGSKLSESALSYGISLAKKYKATIILASIFSSKKPSGLFQERIRETSPQLADEINRMPPNLLMETYHEITVKAINKQGIEAKSILFDGPTSTKSVTNRLIDIVREESIDLIVLTSHGRTGLKKLISGSVIQELMKSLLIPILVLKD
jgi:nucleotide-binding universal stress UspA family protein